MKNEVEIRENWRKMNAAKVAALAELQEKKFGMFIHFGLYSMLEGEYLGKRCEEGQSSSLAEWIMHTLRIPRSEYSSLAKKFDPKDFNAEEIVLLAKKAGMKYIMLTAKHHDGFGLFFSKHSSYTTENAPCKRDLVEEMHNACKKHGVDFCLYYSHSIDWQDGGDGGNADYMTDVHMPFAVRAKNDWDASSEKFDDYIANKAVPQVKELVTRYPDIKYIWYDVPAYMPLEYSYEFYKIVYDIAPNVLISHRVGNKLGDIFCPGDNKIIKNPEECKMPWETVGTMNNSWGYKHYDNDWKSEREVLFWLVEILSKGGNYILNIGPDQTGKTPQQNVEILSKIGDWISENSEAVYGTQAWKTTSEGLSDVEVDGTIWRAQNGFSHVFGKNQFWFTAKENKIYAISLFCGEVDCVKIQAVLGETIKAVKLLGSDIKVSHKKEVEGVLFELEEKYNSELGFVLEISL